MKAIRACLVLLVLTHAACIAAAERRPEQQAALPATGVAAVPEGSSLGRLFYTPAQRAALDEMRRRPRAAVTTTEQAPLPPAPEYVTLNGIVRRSDGTTTVWLNDKQVRGRESSEGLQIAPTRRQGPAGNVTVRVPQTGHVVDLKVGQQLEVNSGEVKERYRAPQRPDVSPSNAPPPNAGNAMREASPSAPPSRRTERQQELLRDLLDEIGKSPMRSGNSDVQKTSPNAEPLRSAAP